MIDHSPTFLPLREAAARFGLNTQALKKRLLRWNAKSSHEPVRLLHGLVHRSDFERWIERMTRRPKTAQEYGREEARRIDSGVRLHGGRR